MRIAFASQPTVVKRYLIPLARIPFHQLQGLAPTPTPQEKMTIVGWDALPVLASFARDDLIASTQLAT